MKQTFYRVYWKAVFTNEEISKHCDKTKCKTIAEAKAVLQREKARFQNSLMYHKNKETGETTTTNFYDTNIVEMGIEKVVMEVENKYSIKKEVNPYKNSNTQDYIVL